MKVVDPAVDLSVLKDYLCIQQHQLSVVMVGGAATRQELVKQYRQVIKNDQEIFRSKYLISDGEIYKGPELLFWVIVEGFVSSHEQGLLFLKREIIAFRESLGMMFVETHKLELIE